MGSRRLTPLEKREKFARELAETLPSTIVIDGFKYLNHQWRQDATVQILEEYLGVKAADLTYKGPEK